jgi:hypothetical protein
VSSALVSSVAGALGVTTGTVSGIVGPVLIGLGVLPLLFVAYFTRKPTATSRKEYYFYREIQKVLFDGSVSERVVETETGTHTELYGDLSTAVGTDLQVVVRVDQEEQIGSTEDLPKEVAETISTDHDDIVNEIRERMPVGGE